MAASLTQAQRPLEGNRHMPIVFVVGTTAEIIKVSPVMRELTDRGCGYSVWSTAQHVTGVDDTLADLKVREPDEYLVAADKRKHIAASSQVPLWGLRVAGSVLRNRKRLSSMLRAPGRRGVVVVHGDTFSTVIGCLIGRFFGARVAHVEAGLRSGSIRNPFPEELNRRIVGRLAVLHFAPTEREANNLRASHAPGEIVVTEANTVIDAVRLAMNDDTDVELPEQFGLITLHRYELLRESEHFSALIRSLAHHAKSFPMVMVAGESERARLRQLGLESLFGSGLSMIHKLAYAKFLPILGRASFVVTDSGGLQEECAALGIPCAVHRTHTERYQGIGENVILTHRNIDELETFLNTWASLRREALLDAFTPSQIIVDTLLQIDGQS